jgi:DNA polymerase delta subunit 2
VLVVVLLLLPGLFPGASPYSSFKRVTNPHQLELGGVLLLGTSGQNIDDMAKYTRGQSRWGDVGPPGW